MRPQRREAVVAGHEVRAHLGEAEVPQEHLMAGLLVVEHQNQLPLRKDVVTLGAPRFVLYAVPTDGKKR